MKSSGDKAVVRGVVADRLSGDAPVTVAVVAKGTRVDFSHLVGKWTPDPDFDEIIAAQGQIEPDKWT